MPGQFANFWMQRSPKLTLYSKSFTRQGAVLPMFSPRLKARLSRQVQVSERSLRNVHRSPEYRWLGTPGIPRPMRRSGSPRLQGYLLYWQPQSRLLGPWPLCSSLLWQGQSRSVSRN
jgi:hypothetical protein